MYKDAKHKHNRHTCSLTGLPNCQQLYKRLKNEIKLAKGQHTALAVIMVDIDQLDEFVNQYGYEQGNQLLLWLSKQIKSSRSLKNMDYIARCNPANFVIILRDVNLNQAYRVAQELLDTLEQQTIVFLEGKIAVTASAGIAEFSQNMDAVGMLKAAEAALYHAKKCGGNCSALYPHC